jgi:hypothetical protein
VYSLGCANCPAPYPVGASYGSLGALPLVAGAASLLSTSLNQFLSTFGLNSSDPVKDQQRIDRIKAVYSEAMQGIPGAEQCLYEMAQGVSSGPYDPRSCAVGSTVAANFAKAVWAEYQARKAAGNVGVSLIAQSPLPGTIAQTAISVLPYAIGAVIVFSVLRRGRGR